MRGTLFGQLISLSLYDLRNFLLQDDLPLEISFYGRILQAYLTGDQEELRFLAEETNPRFSQELKNLAFVRLAIRQNSEATQQVEELLAFQSEGVLAGEIQFVLGLYHFTLENFAAGKFHYLKAYQILLESCPSKALKALFNHFTCQSHLQPNKNFLIDLRFLLQKTRDLAEPIIEGMVLQAMGHEYHRLGSFNQAMIFHQKALDCLQQDVSTFHYENTIANKCHTLICLNRKEEALVELEQLEHSSFTEIRGSVAVIKKMLSHRNVTSESRVNAVWRRKLIYHNTQKKKKSSGYFTDLEEKLFYYIHQQPRDKFEIIEFLYGSEISFDAAEKRFFNVLGRLRKKTPGLIHFTDDRYMVIEKMYLSKVGDLP